MAMREARKRDVLPLRAVVAATAIATLAVVLFGGYGEYAPSIGTWVYGGP